MVDIDSFNQALIECVKACGGSKVVGSLLWPEKPVNEAQRLLLACLNDDRPEKLSPDQTILIMKKSKEKNFHYGIEYICHSLGYTIPSPIVKLDENAELMRQFIKAKDELSNILSKMEAA